MKHHIACKRLVEARRHKRRHTRTHYHPVKDDHPHPHPQPQPHPHPHPHTLAPTPSGSVVVAAVPHDAAAAGLWGIAPINIRVGLPSAINPQGAQVCRFSAINPQGAQVCRFSAINPQGAQVCRFSAINPHRAQVCRFSAINPHRAQVCRFSAINPQGAQVCRWLKGEQQVQVCVQVLCTRIGTSASASLYCTSTSLSLTRISGRQVIGTVALRCQLSGVHMFVRKQYRYGAAPRYIYVHQKDVRLAHQKAVQLSNLGGAASK